MRKRERAADEEEKVPKSPRPTVGGKSLASMGLQDVVVTPLSDSSSSSSDSDDDSGRCHHLTLDSDAVEMAVLDLSISEVPPTCHEPRCGVTWKGAGYDKEGMTQCLECHYIGCTRGLDREDPRGHALAHAASSKHYVAQWYDVPNLGFCFKCVRVMRLSDSPALNQEECSEEDRKIKEQRAMVASKTLPAGKSKDDWGTTASSPRVDWPTAASTPSPTVDWPTAASTPSPTVDWPTVASTPRVDWPTVASSSKVDLGNVARNILDQWVMGAGNDMAESAIGNGYIIRGMPNYGNTCYMNASLQCLLALGKLRTIILGPDASDARLGTMGLELKWLFQETSSVNNARRMLDPQTILGCMQSLYQDRFEVGKMEDSHEFLTLFHTGLDNEVEELNRSHVLEGGGVFPTFGHSIFSSQLIQTISCKSCSYNSVSLPSVHGLQLGVPSKASPARSKPLQVDSTEVKDVVQSHMQTQKNDVPQEIIEVPIDLDFIPKLFDDFEEMEESEADSHNRENKENARGSDIVHDEAKYIDTLGSIEDCLTLFSHSLTNCDNCSKVAELLETNASKSVEPIMASTSVNTSVHGDQTLADSHQEGILSDDTTTEKITSGTSCDEKDLASCSTANEKAESREGVQKAAPSCLTTDQQTDLLSALHIQDTRTQKQDSGKHVLDDHSAQRVEATQNEQTDGNGRSIQTQLISKLPPVLTIQLKKYAPDLSKLRGHVSFKEILHLGPFMDPSSEDKDNSSYRLVGVIVHHGNRRNDGHYIAYVRGSGSSWFWASDTNIREVSLEEVLRCEAYILFYERMND